MPTVVYSAKANEDLLDIWTTIAMDDVAAADRTIDRIVKRARILDLWPMSGVARPRIHTTARLLVERPYLILYAVRDEAVEVVRVVHGARDVGTALFSAGLDPLP